jgi:hypothetical protein
MLNINEYLNKIDDINYALTKIDVPYNPKNFPIEYAMGKDLDIFVSSEHFEIIKKKTNEYFNKYTQFQFKIIKTKNNFRLRMEENDKLHFQIDITIDNLLILDRVKKKNYYILSLENEKKVRLLEVKNHPNKIHHKKWLKYNSTK